jgi:hypothetical protein
MSKKIAKLYPQDFGIKVTDKRFLNKDGSLKKIRGYHNTWHELSDGIRINYHHSLRIYSDESVASIHFLFNRGSGYDQIGGFSKRIIAETKLPFEVRKDYTYSMMLVTKERFLEEITKKEEYKSILEWCLWNL